MFSLLMFNEKHMVETLLTDITSDICKDSVLSDNKKNSYMAEIQFIKALQNIMILENERRF